MLIQDFRGVCNQCIARADIDSNLVFDQAILGRQPRMTGDVDDRLVKSKIGLRNFIRIFDPACDLQLRELPGFRDRQHGSGCHLSSMRRPVLRWKPFLSGITKDLQQIADTVAEPAIAATRWIYEDLKLPSYPCLGTRQTTEINLHRQCRLCKSIARIDPQAGRSDIGECCNLF